MNCFLDSKHSLPHFHWVRSKNYFHVSILLCYFSKSYQFHCTSKVVGLENKKNPEEFNLQTLFQNSPTRNPPCATLKFFPIDEVCCDIVIVIGSSIGLEKRCLFRYEIIKVQKIFSFMKVSKFYFQETILTLGKMHTNHSFVTF